MPVEQQVFWLEISIYNIPFMEIFESQCHFGGVELGDGVWETLVDSQYQRQQTSLSSSFSPVELSYWGSMIENVENIRQIFAAAKTAHHLRQSPSPCTNSSDHEMYPIA